MVQTVFYHSDNTSKTDGYKDNSKIYLSQRVHLQNYASNNMYIEPGKVKSIKNHCIKLQPLVSGKIILGMVGQLYFNLLGKCVCNIIACISFFIWNISYY